MSLLRWLGLALLGLILMAFVGVGFFNQALSPVGIDDNPVLYRLQKGSVLGQVTNELNQKKLIRNPDAFKLYVKFRGWQNKLQSGYYKLSPKMSSVEILNKLTQGITEKIPYTIPEGYRINQASRRLNEFLLSPERYIQLAQKPDSEFFKQFPFLKQGKSLEGFLYPDTYFLHGVEKDLLEAQLKRFEEVILPLWQKRPSSHKLDLYQTVTLASIVELEGLLDRELPIIAGVFLKRLAIGMKLESDPTTEYALGWHQGPKGLSLKDIKVDSPYNTYRYGGLPPGPIGNPGLAAIKAVLYPEKTDYLYFVARGDGSHAFSKSYSEHLSAIRRIYFGKS
jgi:UPF0755 protein